MKTKCLDCGNYVPNATVCKCQKVTMKKQSKQIKEKVATEIKAKKRKIKTSQPQASADDQGKPKDPVLRAFLKDDIVRNKPKELERSPFSGAGFLYGGPDMYEDEVVKKRWFEFWK